MSSSSDYIQRWDRHPDTGKVVPVFRASDVKKARAEKAIYEKKMDKYSKREKQGGKMAVAGLFPLGAAISLSLDEKYPTNPKVLKALGIGGAGLTAVGGAHFLINGNRWENLLSKNIGNDRFALLQRIDAGTDGETYMIDKKAEADEYIMEKVALTNPIKTYKRLMKGELRDKLKSDMNMWKGKSKFYKSEFENKDHYKRYRGFYKDAKKEWIREAGKTQLARLGTVGAIGGVGYGLGRTRPVNNYLQNKQADIEKVAGFKESILRVGDRYVDMLTGKSYRGANEAKKAAESALRTAKDERNTIEVARKNLIDKYNKASESKANAERLFDAADSRRKDLVTAYKDSNNAFKQSKQSQKDAIGNARTKRKELSSNMKKSSKKNKNKEYWERKDGNNLYDQVMRRNEAAAESFKARRNRNDAYNLKQSNKDVLSNFSNNEYKTALDNKNIATDKFFNIKKDYDANISKYDKGKLVSEGKMDKAKIDSIKKINDAENDLANKKEYAASELNKHMLTVGGTATGVGIAAHQGFKTIKKRKGDK